MTLQPQPSRTNPYSPKYNPATHSTFYKMTSTYTIHTLRSVAYSKPRDERSPNTTSSPITMPGVKPSLPIPDILLHHDKVPGRIHHGKDNITDYGFSRTLWELQNMRIMRDEERITCVKAPVWWEERVGMEHPPGFGPKPVVRKEVTIVPKHLAPCMNKRDLNAWAWKAREEEKVKRENRPKDIYTIYPDELEPRSCDGREDSGYESTSALESS